MTAHDSRLVGKRLHNLAYAVLVTIGSSLGSGALGLSLLPVVGIRAPE